MTAQRTPSSFVVLVASTTASGTRKQVTTTVVGCRAVHVSAQTANTGRVFIGDATVSTSVFMDFLDPGESIDIAVDSPSKVYYDVAVNSEGIRAGYVV